MQPPFVREATAHFVRKGKHYLITSGTTGYFPNPSEVAVAQTWHGPYTVLGNPHIDDKTNTSFHSQISSVFKVEGKKDLYIACADRWLPQPEFMNLKYEEYAEYIRISFSADECEENKEKARKWLESLPKEHTKEADYVWLPIQFDGEIVSIYWHDEWKLSDFE